VFVRYFLELHAPFRRIESVLLRDPRSWVPAAARRAEGHRERLLTEAGVPIDGHRISRTVVLKFEHPPLRAPSRTLLPFSWADSQHRVMLPTLEADLELASLGPETTLLAINARYTPPLGRLGAAMDRALLHRVAEATLKDFLDRIGRRLVAMTAGEEHGAATGGPIESH